MYKLNSQIVIRVVSIGSLALIMVYVNRYFCILDEHRGAEQMNGENGEIAETVPACDIIRITGQPENVASAKQALLDLVPITIEVSPFIIAF